MQADTVWRRLAGSCYGTSARSSSLAGSGCIRRDLGALSLGLSLVRKPRHLAACVYAREAGSYLMYQFIELPRR
jgi:hypothetical protein